jgi:hypothetical protein
VARTSKVCVPSARAAVVNGVVQAVNAPASTRHWKVDPDSEEMNVKVGVVSLVVPVGPPVMVVCGSTVSMV